MIKRKKTDYVQFKIRLRESLRKQLEDAARSKHVSLNSEIVDRLEQSLSQASVRDDINSARVAIQDQLRQLSDKLGKEVERRDDAAAKMDLEDKKERKEEFDEQLEAKVSASLSNLSTFSDDVEKLTTRFKAMREARQPKGSKS
jgi:hypothetical protein